MCGKFVSGTDELTWSELVEVLRPSAGLPRPPERAARPGAEVPVVTSSAARGPELVSAIWGLRLGGKGLYFNLRLETVASRFSDDALHRRCILPARTFDVASGEPGRKARPRFRVSPARPLFLAGIWRPDEGPTGRRVTVLTRAARGDLARLHERSPVLVPAALLRAWLGEGAPLPLIEQLRTLDDPAMTIEPLAA